MLEGTTCYGVATRGTRLPHSVGSALQLTVSEPVRINGCPVTKGDFHDSASDISLIYEQLDNGVKQIRAVFTIPARASENLFSNITEERPEHMAYVEWFSPLTRAPDSKTGMFNVTRSLIDGGRLCSVMDVRRVIRSVHLSPRYGGPVPRAWTYDVVLEECKSFTVNSHSDRHMFQMFEETVPS